MKHDSVATGEVSIVLKFLFAAAEVADIGRARAVIHCGKRGCLA
ncbi:hypothetical protein [Sandaracinobacter neustonicus]|nr:hypothetical protein [Sandaracinobacter neustonicus]